MTELKCKNCGAHITYDEDKAVVICTYCESSYKLTGDTRTEKTSTAQQSTENSRHKAEDSTEKTSTAQQSTEKPDPEAEAANAEKRRRALEAYFRNEDWNTPEVEKKKFPHDKVSSLGLLLIVWAIIVFLILLLGRTTGSSGSTKNKAPQKATPSNSTNSTTSTERADVVKDELPQLLLEEPLAVAAVEFYRNELSRDGAAQP